MSRLAAALGTITHDLLPIGPPPDALGTLRGQAKALFDDLLQSADEPTLIMLCPLLARLGESPTRRR